MSKWTLLLMICALAVPALAATKTVPDDFATIQAAIDAADSGDTVYVRFGIYHEFLYIDKSLRLVGDPRVGVLIIGSSYDQDVVQISTLAGDKVVIESMSITNGKRGISARGQGEVVVQDCVVSECQVGIQVGIAKATVQHTRFYDHELSGVAVMRTSGIFAILSNQFVLCEVAIGLLEMDGDVKIANNVIYMGHWGILADESCRGRVAIEGQANKLGFLKINTCSLAYPNNLWPNSFLDLKYGELLARAYLLYEEAENLKSSEEYSQAVTEYLLAKSVLQDGCTGVFQADIWRSIGKCYIYLEQFESALAAFEQARALYEAFGCLDQVATSSTLIGIGHEALENYDQAIANYKFAIAISQAIGDEENEAFALRNLADSYWGAGKFEKAIEVFRLMLPKLHEEGMREEEAEALKTLAGSYAALGGYEIALYCLEQGLFKAETPNLRSQLLAVQGGIYYLVGLNDQAIRSIEEALNLARIADQELAAEVLEFLGQLYAIEDKREQAVICLEEAISIFQHLEEHQDAGDALQSLGLSYMAWEEYENACAYFRDALEKFRETEAYEQECVTALYLGESYYYLQNYDKALELLKKSANSAQTTGDWETEIDSYVFLSNCYYELGFSNDGWRYLQSAIVIGQHAANEGLTRGTSELADLQQQLGLQYFNMNDLENAISAWEAAVAVVEQVRGQVLRAHFKSAFMIRKTNIYKELVPVLVEVRKPEKAIAYAERAKSRTLVDMMETAMVRETAVLPAAVQTASGVLKELSGIQMAAGEPALGMLISPSGTRSGLARAQQRTQEEYEAILDALEREHPSLGETLSVNPERLWEHFQYVQGELGEGTVALEYFVTEDETILWVITEEGVQTASRIAITRDELTEQVRGFREEIEEQPVLDQVAVSYLSALEKGRDLYELLIAPVEEYLQGATHLVIIPSDVLFYLPFEALVNCPGCEERDLYGGKFLIESYSVSYAPSLSSLYWPFQHAGDGTYESVLAVGADPDPLYPLEYSAEEALAVSASFPHADLLLKQQCTEEEIKLKLQQKTYDVIHLSTHGRFDPILPLLSQVQFLPSAGEDGALHAGEILGLDLAGSLVVLSACQTALPPELTEESAGLVVGDEIQGLGQALFTAGASSAILTLWNVNDCSTSYLMEKMYQRLQDGAEKGEALRQAQLLLLGDPMYSHPCYWAPFVLYGDWR
jgi:CHAT domain-containing protein/uncharacterized protein HemY